ncbi:MAG: TolC family protein [Leptolyngbyaceae cyanobacterium MO_188.B28]|nr:TolC family protein [Leptolyngbyaceae cyanobacterium MO_188.B28]
MKNSFHCSSSMLLTLLSMGSAIALVPFSAKAMPVDSKEAAPKHFKAHFPQSPSISEQEAPDPISSANRIPENFDSTFNPHWSPTQLLDHEPPQAIPRDGGAKGEAAPPFKPVSLLNKSVLDPSSSSGYIKFNANAYALPVQLTVDELAQAPLTDEASQDRLTPFDPEPSPSELTVEEGAAPEYLNPDPNPLLFPTQPEEVDILGTQPITLEQAIELAYRNNETLQVALLQLDQARSALREAQALLFPTLTLNSDLTGQENTTSSTFAGSDRDIDVNFNNRLELSYDVFRSGFRSGTIGAAERRVRNSELNVEVIQEDLRLDTSNNYYDLQNAIEQIRINQAFVEETERNLEDNRLREEVGVGTRFDVLRAEVQAADARQELVQAQSDKEVAQRALAQRLNLPPSLDISTTPVEVAESWPLSLEESIVLAFQNRAELEQQLVEREINEQERRRDLAALGPTISLFANYDFTDTLNQSGGIEDTYRFGARLNWTLFEGGAAAARAAQQERDIEIAETNFSATRNGIRFNVEQSYYSLEANKTNIITAELAVEQAKEALELANLRLDAGVGTQLDVLTAQRELTDAEVRLIDAILGYNRSLAALQRAISNLADPSSEELY